MANSVIQNHPDFKCYYDKNHLINYWLLGYFGGGNINISKAMEVAKEYAAINNVPLESVMIDEIQKSTRCKYFKYIYSEVTQHPMQGAFETESFYNIIS